MCCLFGLIDTEQRFSGKQKSEMLHILATAAEERGTDASGLAYHENGSLVIRKAPVAGHKLKFSVPDAAVSVMGHTRMTTQGNARKNRNNHPFYGQVGGEHFALAHNGVIYNDAALRRQLCLPKTKIETDSYVAVQLIEKQKALDFDSLKFAAEKLEGSFTLTALDWQQGLYVVKGDSPIYLLRWPKLGLYLYASTEQIMRLALRYIPLSIKEAVRIDARSGEIIKIDRKGDVTRGTFDDSGLYQCYRLAPLGLCPMPVKEADRSYIDELKSVAGAFGYTPEMVDRLIERGYMPEEIEEFLYCGEV